MKHAEKTAQNGHLYIIQEFIPGPDENLHLVQGYFNNNSEPLGVFTFKRIRQYPRHFGNGALCESKWIPPLAEQVCKFIRAIGYQGIIDAELKLDPRDNQFKFIEINPRPGWQTRLATRCGVNNPYLAYLDALGKPVPKAASQAEGVKWLAMHGDMKSAFEAWRNGDLTLSQYVRSFSGKIEFAVFAWDDPLPFLYVTKQVARAGFRKLTRKIFRRACP